MTCILPAFLEYRAEGEIIGRLLTGYGELEYELAMCVAAIVVDQDLPFKLVYRLRGENRVIATEMLALSKLEIGRARTVFEQGVKALHVCRRIRNQYAHSNWGTDRKGLWFLDLEVAAEEGGRFLATEHKTRRLDASVLEEQEAYFCFVRECFQFVTYEVRRQRGEVPAVQGYRPPRSRSSPRLHS